ncbi:MAG TPA: LamG domain-containing protein [Chthoniobacterales bacterium]|nr:LamG domain-containing protein [Chthoniobacterales bacterium]
MKLWRDALKAMLSRKIHRVRDSGTSEAVSISNPPLTTNISRAGRCRIWLRNNRALFLMISLVVLIALIPLYGILFPPLVDLPEHLLISKLLWEKLSGVSRLNLELSFFLGYRLIPALMMVVIPFCKLWGISFVYLPRIVTMTLMSLHAVVVVTILSFGLKDRSWKSCGFAACFAMPAVVCMYSACWFIGFVNYTLAITLLIPAIFLTERFLCSGKLRDALFLFLTLLMVYTAHPFAPTFWLVWCFSRALAGFATRTFVLEWKKLIGLGLIFAPIPLYHFLATAGTELAPASRSFLYQPAILSINDWYQGRFRGLLNGAFFQADNSSDARLFGLMAIGLLLCAAVVAFRSTQDGQVRNAALASLFLPFIASWVNEKFIPIPGGHWLAYDYRFSSTSYAICLAVAGMILIRSLPVSTDKRPYKIIFVLLAGISILASVRHLMEVRKAYGKFDVPARKYVAKVFKREQPGSIQLPRSRYHPDGSFLNNYICLMQPDCNAPGTTFASGHAGILYPVRVKASNRVPTGDLVGHWKMDEPNRRDSCIDASGNGNTGTPRGTAVVDGKIGGKARLFNGNGDYIDIPPIAIPDAITVAAWVYSDNFVQNAVIVTRNPVNSQWALLLGSDGLVKWRGAGFRSSVVCAAPTNRSWHHIVGKQKGTLGSLYVDGAQCASGPLAAIGNAPTSISIGRYNTVGFDYFTGRIDDVRIYNRALSDTEILQLFTSGQLPSSKAQTK